MNFWKNAVVGVLAVAVGSCLLPTYTNSNEEEGGEGSDCSSDPTFGKECVAAGERPGHLVCNTTGTGMLCLADGDQGGAGGTGHNETGGGAGSTGGSQPSQCTTGSDCGTATECRRFTCTNGTCVTDYTANGIKASGYPNDPGYCMQTVCDGAGNPKDVPDPTKKPPGTACTKGECNGGTPSQTKLPLGTECDAGKVCNESSQCASGCYIQRGFHATTRDSSEQATIGYYGSNMDNVIP